MTTILYPEPAFTDVAYESGLFGLMSRSSAAMSVNWPTSTMPTARAPKD